MHSSDIYYVAKTLSFVYYKFIYNILFLHFLNSFKGVVMKLRLLTRLLIFILLPALIGLSVVAGLAYVNGRKALEKQIAEEMTLVLERQKSELANITGLLWTVLSHTGETGNIQTLLHKANNGVTGPMLDGLLAPTKQALEEVVHNFPQIKEVALLNAAGKVLFHNNPELIGKNFSERAYFRTAMQGRPGAENLFSELNREITTILSVPVKDDEGHVLGVLYGNLDIAALSGATVNTIKIGSTGICYVYDGRGIMVMHPNAAYVGDADGGNDWTRKILDERDGRLTYVWNEREKVAYFRAIPEIDWIVVLAVERDDLLSPIFAMLRDNALVVTVSALLVGLILLFTARNIVATLRSCAVFVEHVAKGDLTIPRNMQDDMNKAGRRSDEIGVLSRGIAVMVENIRRLFAESSQKTMEAERAVEEAQKAMKAADEARRAAENARREGMLAAAGSLEGVVAVVSSASSELSAQIEESERGAAEQAARAAETATAMEEMNSTVVEVAKNAGIASEVSSRTREKAESGALIVQKAVQSILQVQQESLALKDDMGRLGEHARSITQIMSVISDIADQTNLLALNAAIEAARAGEAGRGFAVVADEVRKLAEKTMASTTDVGNAIKAIQDSAGKSMNQVDRAVQTIEEATAFAGESGEALREIVTMADNTADQVRAIATASEEQSASSEEINRSVSQVTGIADKTARAMQEAAQAVNELAAQAHRLSELIDDMKRG